MTSPIDHDAALLGRILATIPEFVVLVDRDGVIRYINRVEPGFDRDQVIGMEAGTVLRGVSPQVFQATLDSVLSGKEVARFELEATMADGSPAWYRCQISPYREGSMIIGAVVIGSNITELKAAQDTVVKLRQLLPICSWCGRIRTGEASWMEVEIYLERKLETRVTHGLCPDCFQREVQRTQTSVE